MQPHNTQIYFDNHATTAVDPRVLEAMLPTFSDVYGNAESGHPFGWSAKLLVEKARAQVAKLLNAKDPAKEIVFTAGATESVHLAILSALNSPRAHVITAATEHKAVLEAIDFARRAGASVTVLPVDGEGRLTSEQVVAAIQPNTTLVSLMHGNNEIGTLHPILEIGQAIRELSDERTNNVDSADPRILFHVDAAQTAGKHPIDVDAMKIDLLSLSAHKFHGPKGVGALYVRHSEGRSVHLTPLFSGGGQERGIRSGTLNVSGIVGLGAACEIALEDMESNSLRLSKMRDQIIGAALALGDAKLNGPCDERLCNNVNITFAGVEQDELMLSLKGFAYSAASACAGPTQSHVLEAIGALTTDPFTTTIRIGLSRLTTEEEVAHFTQALRLGIQNAREKSGSYGSQVKAVPKNQNK